MKIKISKEMRLIVAKAFFGGMLMVWVHMTLQVIASFAVFYLKINLQEPTNTVSVLLAVLAWNWIVAAGALNTHDLNLITAFPAFILAVAVYWSIWILFLVLKSEIQMRKYSQSS